MIPFYSKRNQVYPCLYRGEAAVEKHFAEFADWQRERELYAALGGHLPIPVVLAEDEKILITRYEPYPTFLALLERQEAGEFDALPWRGLAQWLERCCALCGKLPEDGNLRNFLWNADSECVIGLDLESYGTVALSECGAAVVASLLHYDPVGTPVKKRAAAVLTELLRISDEQIASAEQMLRRRRVGKESTEMSGVVLAGGLSSRMGQPKALLSLEGRTLLERQVDKLRALGITDIMISGSFSLPGIRSVADEYPQRGPLGGLHACLKAALHPACLVLSVDAPMLPVNVLASVCRKHRGGVTALRHGGEVEPLIAVYDSTLHETIAPMIEERGAPVRALQEKALWHYFDYLGPEEFLYNCNTPEEFSRAALLVKAYRERGFVL